MEVKFGKRLKELRLEKGLSQETLAKKLNVAFNTISDWENGKHEPDFKMLMTLARFFDVSSDYLLGLED